MASEKRDICCSTLAETRGHRLTADWRSGECCSVYRCVLFGRGLGVYSESVTPNRLTDSMVVGVSSFLARVILTVDSVSSF